MGEVLFIPLFEIENQKFFFINTTSLECLREGGAEVIYYFSESFWEKYSKPFGMERVEEIINSTPGSPSTIAMVAEWKYLDKYARILNLDMDIPNDCDTYVNKFNCIAIAIAPEIEKHMEEGWDCLHCRTQDEEVIATEQTSKFYMDENLEKRLISAKMLSSNEKILRYYDENLGNINLSMN